MLQGTHAPAHRAPGPQESPSHTQAPPWHAGVAPVQTAQLGPQWAGSDWPQGSQVPPMQALPAPHWASAVHGTQPLPSQTGVAPPHGWHAGPHFVALLQGLQVPASQAVPLGQEPSVQPQDPPRHTGASAGHRAQDGPQWSGSVVVQGEQTPPLHHAPSPQCASSVHTHTPPWQTGVSSPQTPHSGPQCRGSLGPQLWHTVPSHHWPGAHDASVQVHWSPLHAGAAPLHGRHAAPHLASVLQGWQPPPMHV